MAQPQSIAQFVINVPVTLEELAHVTAQAGADGLTVRDYVRSCILPGQVDPVDIVANRLRAAINRRP